MSRVGMKRTVGGDVAPESPPASPADRSYTPGCPSAVRIELDDRSGTHRPSGQAPTGPTRALDPSRSAPLGSADAAMWLALAELGPGETPTRELRPELGLTDR